MRGLRGRSLALAAAVLAVGVGASTLTGCGGRDALVIYSGRTSNLIKPLLDQFVEETGISIDIHYDSSSQDLALLVDEEGDATQADVLISQSPGAVGYLAARDRLAELPDSVLELVPEEDAASDGTWVGLSGRVRSLVYNTEEVDPATLPDSVLDLADERYAGQVAVSPTNASFQDFVTVLRSNVGEAETEQFLRALADGDAPTYENNTAIVEAVGRGEVPMGLVNHYYALNARDEDPDMPVENHFFASGDYGSTVLVTAASIVEGSDRVDEARRFVEFMLSEQAQTYFSEQTNEYPLASGVEPGADLVPMDEIAPVRVDLGELGEGLEATTDMIDASGLTG